METSFMELRDDIEHSWNLIWQALILGMLVGPAEGIIIHFLMRIFGILDIPTLYG